MFPGNRAGRAPAHYASLKMEKADKFVVVNSRILDFEKYRKDFALLGRIMAGDIKEYLRTVGFTAIKSRGVRSNFRNKMRFHNASLDFEITLTMKKKGKFEFV